MSDAATWSGETSKVRFAGSRRRRSVLRKRTAIASGSQHENVVLVPGSDAFTGVEDGRKSSLVRAELIRLSQIERSRFYQDEVHSILWPMCQSVPEMLLWQTKICAVLANCYQRAAHSANVLSLASVLARELGSELSDSSVDLLLSALSKAISSTDPRKARASFDALGYVLRYCCDSVLAGIKTKAWPRLTKFYGTLLGSAHSDARTLGARAIASVLRRAGDKPNAKHAKKLIRRIELQQLSNSLKHGIASLFCEVCAGVQGRLHTVAVSVLPALFSVCREGQQDIADSVVTMLLERTRPGDELEVMWHALIEEAKLSASGTRRLAMATEWRSARLLNRRSAIDAALSESTRSRRALELAECLEVIVGKTETEPEKYGSSGLNLALAVWKHSGIGAKNNVTLAKRLSRTSPTGQLALAFADAGFTRFAYEAVIELPAESSKTALMALAVAAQNPDQRQQCEEVSLFRKLVEPRLYNEKSPALRATALTACHAFAPELTRTHIRAICSSGESILLRVVAVDTIIGLASDEQDESLLLDIIVDLFNALDRNDIVNCVAKLEPQILRCAGEIQTSIKSDPELAMALACCEDYPRRTAKLAVRLASRLCGSEDAKEMFELWSEILTLPAKLSSERNFSRLLSQAEVLARRPALPLAVAQACAVQALGLLTIRFEPVWAMVARLLAVLAETHPDALWPLLARRLDRAARLWGYDTLESEATAQVFSDPEQRLSETWRKYENSPDGESFLDLLCNRNEAVERDRGDLDADRYFVVLCDAARACGVLSARPGTQAGARAVVMQFIRFLQYDFCRAFADDPDALDVLAVLEEDTTMNDQPIPPRGAVYSRLEAQLKIFAESRAPRSLPKSELLCSVFERLLSKSRGDVARLALACLKPYKLSYLSPYSDRLENLLDDKSMRDTLVKMKINREALTSEDDGIDDKWVVDDAHRTGLIPLLCRILLGRFRAKSASIGRRRGAPKARRATIISFVAGLEAHELDGFVRLALRPFSSGNLDALREASAAAAAVAAAKPSRLVGSLQLLRTMTPRFGYKVEALAPLFLSLALAAATKPTSVESGPDKVQEEEITAVHQKILEHDVDEDDKSLVEEIAAANDSTALPDAGTEVDENEFDDDEEDKEFVESGQSRSEARRCRVLALRCVKDILEQYAAGNSLWELEGDLGERLWSTLGPHLTILRSDKGTQEPVALDVVRALAETPALRTLLNDTGVAACCAAASRRSSIGMSAMLALLEADDDEGTYRQLKPYTKQIVNALAAELRSASDNMRSIIVQRSLRALRRIAVLASSGDWSLDASEASMLTSALCPRLVAVFDKSSGTDPTSVRESILECLDAVLPRVGNPRSHLEELAALLAPPRPRRRALRFYAAPDWAEARRAVVRAILRLIRGHLDLCEMSQYIESARVLSALSRESEDNEEQEEDDALDRRSDQDQFRSSRRKKKKKHSGLLSDDEPTSTEALSALASLQAWTAMLNSDEKQSSAAPVVAYCVSTLRAESTLRDAACRTLRSFISAGPCTELLQRYLVPHICDALDVADDASRRAHVSVLAALVRRGLYFADLVALTETSNLEVDFFENVAHLQNHRRSRAYRRAVNLAPELDPSSIRRVLIPLALQPLRDVHATDTLRVDAAQCLAACAARLPWSRYSELVRGLCAKLSSLTASKRHESDKDDDDDLEIQSRSRQKRNGVKKVQRTVSKALETAAVTALAAAVDACPFEFNENEDNKVNASALLRGVRALVKKPVRDPKTGARNEILRAPLALSLCKLVSRLPKNLRKEEMHSVLVSVCTSLRHRDATQREVVRSTLAKMTPYVDVNVMLAELETALRQGGYMLAVRSASLHAIVAAIASQKLCRFPCDMKHVTDLLLNDLLGEAAAAKATAGAGEHRSGSTAGVPEAKRLVSRTYESFELVARSVAYDADSEGQAAQLTKPLFQALRLRATLTDERTASEAARCRAALARVATGLANNQSLSTVDLLNNTAELLSTALQISSPHDLARDINDMEEEDASESLVVFDHEAALPSTESKAKRRRLAGEVQSFLPSEFGLASDARAAHDSKKASERENLRVLDGAQAPRLTGRNNDQQTSSRIHEDMIEVETLRFAILLLGQALKKRGKQLFQIEAMRRVGSEERAAAEPLSALLAKVYRKRAAGDDEIRLHIVHIAASLLEWRLDSSRTWSRTLAKVALSTLRRSAHGLLFAADEVQASFKMLAILLSPSRDKKMSSLSNDDNDDESFDEESLSDEDERSTMEVSDEKTSVTLSDAQLKAVASSVHVALASTSGRGSFASQRAATYALLKVLVLRPVLVSEIYDIMDTLSELWVTSLERSERRRACKLFLYYIMHYPLGKKRRQKHLGQLVAGLEYEYEEGRLAALEALGAALRTLPPALIEEHFESFFMSLALRLANEPKQNCVDAAVSVLSTLLKRVSTHLFRGALDRILAWLREALGQSGEAADSLRLLAARCLSAVCRSDNSTSGTAYLSQQGSLLNSFLDAISENILILTMAPVALGMLIDAAKQCCDTYLPKDIEPASSLPVHIAQCLSHADAVPRLAASRFFVMYLHRESSGIKNTFRDLARALVVHLDQPDTHFEQTLGSLAVDNLTALATRLRNDDLDWLFQRLSSMASRRGHRRRQCVFLWISAVIDVLDRSVIENQLPLLLAPLHRTIEEEDRRDRERRRDIATRTISKDDDQLQAAVAAQANELLRKLEDRVGSEALAPILANVAAKLKARRTERKTKRAIQAVADPAAAAQAKIHRNLEKRRSAASYSLGKREKTPADDEASSSGVGTTKKSKHETAKTNRKEVEDLFHSASNLLA